MVQRRVVRIALMRNTIHLVTTDDAYRLRSVLQPMMTRSFASSSFARHLVGVDLEAVAATGRDAVEEQPLTFAELGSGLGLRWPGRDPSALAQVVRAHVPLVQVPPRGLWGQSGLARHTSLETWAAPPAPWRTSVEDVVLRYLGAFGPASVADVQAWSGLTRLRPVVTGLGHRLVTFSDESGVELFDLPDGRRPHPDTPAPIRFIAEYDNILLSHARRSRIISDDDRRLMASANGVVPGTVLVDGFVGAFWKMTSDRRRATITVTTLRRLSRGHRADVAAEGRRLLAVAAPTVATHDVVIEAV
jgi:hypothetical protein